MAKLLKVEHCQTCVGWNWGRTGYVPASGSGENGVLIVAEAAGETEATEGMPLCGKVGYDLWQQLARIGVQREGFKVHNVLSCRPPDNKLAKMPYEEEAIAHCSPLLDNTIGDMYELCSKSGKTFVIITLGRIAFKRVMGINDKSPILREDYLCYPFWSDRYKAWVIAVDHPGYIVRGNSHLWPVLQFGVQRALEIAANGLTLDTHDYLLDPGVETFMQWIADYERALKNDPTVTLSYDIETPGKQGQAEDTLAKEDGDDYTIIRCSFAYRPNEAVSVRWAAEYRAGLEQLFASGGDKVGWNSANYDDPRITQQMPIRGDRIDAMLCWHVLNSALDKSLGSVTPYYVPTTGLWKHLSDSEPAFYNAKDSDMALRNYIGIRRDLEKNKQWDVLDRHVNQLNRALNYMSGQGVLRDEVMRRDSEVKLQDMLDVVELKMEANVPQAARKLKVFKKAPKITAGMIEVNGDITIKLCSSCGADWPGAVHVRSVGKKALKAGATENPCLGAKAVKKVVAGKLWAKPLEFKVSKLGLTNYQAALKHQAIINRKERKVTFDEPALMKLIKKYPADQLYPLILEHRELTKLLSTYIGVTNENGSIRGGMPVGRDGRIHTLFTHNPSTLRLASQNPNLQNLPRPKGADDLATIIRNLIVAELGHIFTARDYSGIEAVLVGYFAPSPSYIRLAKIDVHSFYTAYCLNALDGRVHSNDLPQIGWPDEKLIPHLAAIKKEFKHDRNTLYKHLVHGGNFAQQPKGAQEKIFRETGIEFPVSKIAKVMDVYFELFPEIKKWHRNLLLQAEQDGFLRNPFGYVHRFARVFKYRKEDGIWLKEHGDDANKCIAFLPQSTAAGIIKEAILRLYFERFDEAGQWLRLQVHDEIFSEVPEDLVDGVDAIMKVEMERPIKALPLPASYKMGEYLVIDTEGKRGMRWGSMK